MKKISHVVHHLRPFTEARIMSAQLDGRMDATISGKSFKRSKLHEMKSASMDVQR